MLLQVLRVRDPQAHIHSPEEVEDRLEEAVRRNAKELLVLTGERPEVNPEVAERLRSWGHEDFISYVVWACERALERGMLPHTNLGVLSPRRPRPAARGHRLAGPDARVDLRAADGDRPRRLADQAPGARGWRRSRRPASCGSRSRAGSSSASARPRRSASPRWRRWPRSHERHGHIQEVILQNFVPHPRYYGARGGGDRRRGRAAALGEIDENDASHERVEPMPLPFPSGPRPMTLDDMKRLIAECRRLMPDVGVQVPPNLSDWWVELVEAGATDLGGLSANGDHISPEHAFPSPHQVRKAPARRRATR